MANKITPSEQFDLIAELVERNDDHKLDQAILIQAKHLSEQADAVNTIKNLILESVKSAAIIENQATVQEDALKILGRKILKYYKENKAN